MGFRCRQCGCLLSSTCERMICSSAAEQTQQAYLLLPSLFPRLDERWGPSTINRFACPATCQPLAPPFTGLFCSKNFHLDAAWKGVFAVSCGGENNWLLPLSRTLREQSPTCACLAQRDIFIVPFSAWAP